ncbi:MAG: hypothetical protein ACFFD4_11505 [Candidatus Odinarchaeota archaeon]
MATYQCVDCKKYFPEEKLEKIIREGNEGVVYKCGCKNNKFSNPVSRIASPYSRNQNSIDKLVEKAAKNPSPSVYFRILSVLSSSDSVSISPEILNRMLDIENINIKLSSVNLALDEIDSFFTVRNDIHSGIDSLFNYCQVINKALNDPVISHNTAGAIGYRSSNYSRLLLEKYGDLTWMKPKITTQAEEYGMAKKFITDNFIEPIWSTITAAIESNNIDSSTVSNILVKLVIMDDVSVRLPTLLADCPPATTERTVRSFAKATVNRIKMTGDYKSIAEFLQLFVNKSETIRLAAAGGLFDAYSDYLADLDRFFEDLAGDASRLSRLQDDEIVEVIKQKLSGAGFWSRFSHPSDLKNLDFSASYPNFFTAELVKACRSSALEWRSDQEEERRKQREEEELYLKEYVEARGHEPEDDAIWRRRRRMMKLPGTFLSRDDIKAKDLEEQEQGVPLHRRILAPAIVSYLKSYLAPNHGSEEPPAIWRNEQQQPYDIGWPSVATDLPLLVGGNDIEDNYGKNYRREDWIHYWEMYRCFASAGKKPRAVAMAIIHVLECGTPYRYASHYDPSLDLDPFPGNEWLFIALTAIDEQSLPRIKSLLAQDYPDISKASMMLEELKLIDPNNRLVSIKNNLEKVLASNLPVEARNKAELLLSIITVVDQEK